jgi:UDP-N-acetylmuramate: L-alanyl-gamma-D-glutamyl-meso-diaminopimelate ligase
MQKIHFIALGGSVMHQLAIALHRKGYQVSGSDDEIYEPARTNLDREGLLPAVNGWHPERITPDLDAVLLGMHAREDNPELVRARELGLRVFSFPEYIYRESREKTRVVVGGSHGKTTITSMIMHVLQQSGKDFDYLVGAALAGFAYSVRLSDAPVLVCEGDEYPASALEKVPKFLFYHPQIAVLSGIAWDHINVFPSREAYLDVFRRFIGEMESDSTLIYQQEDPVLADLVREHGTHLRLIPYGTPASVIRDGITVMTLDDQAVPLRVFGRHNLQNALAAKWVTTLLGVEEKDFREAISTFEGASRRLEKVADFPGATLFRDFAHAPSKVRASLQAVRDQFPGRHLAAVLELHTYSSLNARFLPEYHHALDGADQAAVFYSNHALAVKRLPPLEADQVREAFGRDDLQVLQDTAQLQAFLKNLPAGDTNLLMMSSGSFDGLPVTEMIHLWQKN